MIYFQSSICTNITPMCTVTQCNHDLQRDYFLCFDAESKKPVQSFSVSPCQFREREDCITYLHYNSVQLSDKTPKGLRIPQHPVTWVKFFHLPLSTLSALLIIKGLLHSGFLCSSILFNLKQVLVLLVLTMYLLSFVLLQANQAQGRPCQLFHMG